MKQEDQKRPASFWKAFWEHGLYAWIPLILARVMAMPGSIGIVDEKYEYSLSRFLAGITFLLFLLLFTKSYPDWKKTAHRYVMFPTMLILLVLLIHFWTNAFKSFITLF
jgi:hypothetical protein